MFQNNSTVVAKTALIYKKFVCNLLMTVTVIVKVFTLVLVQKTCSWKSYKTFFSRISIIRVLVYKYQRSNTVQNRRPETLNISDSSHAQCLKPRLGQLSSSIGLMNPDYWLIFCEISRGQQRDSFGANNGWEAERNPRKVRRKGFAELREGHGTFRLLRNQFPFSGKMSLVFYWPISFKSPTPFPGQPRHLWAKNV